ncbi:MAG TPA: DUF4287 domain-containing protein [Propionibacteriaceae bacterium]|nr:DUF4287 domain-containing protein [Propionibacteriaceae bacterium]
MLDEAAARSYGPQTKAGEVLDWLKEEYGVGRGHATAFYGCSRTDRAFPRSTSAPPAVTVTSRSPCGSTASRPLQLTSPKPVVGGPACTCLDLRSLRFGRVCTASSP